MDLLRFEDRTMTRINEVLNPDVFPALLRLLRRQLRSLVRRVGYRPERRYMRGSAIRR